MQLARDFTHFGSRITIIRIWSCLFYHYFEWNLWISNNTVHTMLLKAFRRTMRLHLCRVQHHSPNEIIIDHNSLPLLCQGTPLLPWQPKTPPWPWSSTPPHPPPHRHPLSPGASDTLCGWGPHTTDEVQWSAGRSPFPWGQSCGRPKGGAWGGAHRSRMHWWHMWWGPGK